ncbi:fibronectin type III/BRCA1 domain-containing protein [Pholiota molesta]|nr:fibronectin type III/BRCA1 domain-containing protein [Pholiota molesta]
MSLTKSQESFTFTVGKLDAGMAILLGERAHLIEFPSILLPPGATTGSIVNIAVHQNHVEEQKRESEFWSLQEDILDEFGKTSPEPPKLSVRNITQTSVTLEWPPIKLATAKLRSLDIYRNGERLSAVPSPLTNTSTKHSGMDINTEYSFQLVLRTTAGTFPSNVLRVRTHTMADTSGVSVCFGNVQDAVLLENAKLALREMGAKWSDTIQIDTSHFVCTTPAAGGNASAPGVTYQRALQLSIPVVQPHWILACHAEQRMVPIASFYLGASATTPVSANFSNRPQSMSHPALPQSAPANRVRASLPPPSRAPGTPPSSAFVNQPPSAGVRQPEPTVEERDETDPDTQSVHLERAASLRSEKRKSRNGSMNKEFKFPPTSPVTPSSVLAESAKKPASPPADDVAEEEGRAAVVTPSNIEVPAPPPMEKENSMSQVSLNDSVDDDVGDTVDIPLN